MKKLVGLAALAAVSGCVSPYVGTPYERASANVHSIAIEHDAVPEKLSAWEVASVGSNFGLIGALTDAAIQQSRETALMGPEAGAAPYAPGTKRTGSLCYAR